MAGYLKFETSDPIDFLDEADKEAALEEFDDAMRASEARLKSIRPSFGS